MTRTAMRPHLLLVWEALSAPLKSARGDRQKILNVFFGKECDQTKVRGRTVELEVYACTRVILKKPNCSFRDAVVSMKHVQTVSTGGVDVGTYPKSQGRLVYAGNTSEFKTLIFVT